MERKVIPFLSIYLIISDDRPRGTVEYTLKSGVNSGLLATSSQYKEYVADGLMGYKQFMFNAFSTILYDKYTYDFATAANFFKAAGDIEDEVMEAVNEILNSPLAESKKKNSKKKAMKESRVKWTTEIGEATAYELNEQVKKTLSSFGYTCGGNESDRPDCTPKTYYVRDKVPEGQTVYLCSVKGEFYDEVIIQVCDSKVVGMANYTIRNPEGVLWMGQSPKEFIEDISDMTSGFNEF